MAEKNWKKKVAIVSIAALLMTSGNTPIHLVAEDTESPAPDSVTEKSTSPEKSASPSDTPEGSALPEASPSADVTTSSPEPDQAQRFHVTYQSSDETMGTVSVTEESGTVTDGSVSYSGSEAIPNDGYQFENWTSESDGITVVVSTTAAFTPSDVTADTVYTANFAVAEQTDKTSNSFSIMAAAANINGINLNEDGASYVTGAQVTWQNGSSWSALPSADSGTKIPLNVPLRITVNFSGISTADLRDNHGGILYYDIPSLLTDPYFSSNTIMNGKDEIGTITAADNRITLTLKTSYLDEIIRNDGENSTIQNASFTFMATPDPERVREDYSQTLTIGDTAFKLYFDSDYDARNGTLTLQKPSPQYIEEGSNSYLQYKLKITSGDVAMPSVTVTDHFTQNETAVEEYVGITDTSLPLTSAVTAVQPYETITGGDGTAVQSSGTIALISSKTASSPGTFVWTIGDMRANETRTLNYRVKLIDGYAGAATGTNGVITNTATPASETYARSSVTSTFTPSTSASVTKSAGTITVDNTAGTVTIPYTVTITASSSNSWTLRNVKISDDFGVYNTNLSKANLSAVLLKDNGSWSNFLVHDGTSASGKGKPAGIQASESRDLATPYFVIKPSSENLGFNLYIGDLEAGKSKTVTFDVVLSKAVLDYIPGGTSTSSSIQIWNRAGAYSDDTNATYGNQTLGSANTSSTASSQQWDRKIQGTATTSDITQSAPDSFYSYSGTGWEISTGGDDVTIPAGSIQYQVAVNEKGLWNVSSALFSDMLSSNGKYLNYAGYLRLDYYADGLGSSASYGSDQAAVNALSALRPDRTLWLDINDMASFSFTPNDLGSNSFSNGAYLLTYYAKPVNTSGYSKTTAGNSFALSGTVIGPGGTSRNLSAIQVSTSTLLSGSMDFSVSKSAWYGNIQDTSGGFSRGSLYWIITATGTQIPAGLQLQDTPGSNQKIYGDIGTNSHVSIAGVYLSSVEDADALATAYTQFSQIQKNNLFTAVSDDNWKWSVSNNVGTFTFNHTIDLNNQQLYIIVRSEPTSSAFNNSSNTARPTATFTNSLSMRNSTNEAYTSVNSDSIYIARDGTNFKEVGEFGNYDATDNTWSGTTQVSNGNAPKDKILSSWTAADGSAQTLSSGTYIDYRLVVNYAGNEEGTLRLEDLVPKGMEPVYVRYFWMSRNFWASDVKNKPSVQPEIVPIEGLGDNWVDIGVKNARLDGNAGAATAGNLTRSAYGYYNSAAGRILIDVSNLTRDTSNSVSTRDIQVQIVMRVTDPEALKGTQKTFGNTMNVYTASGSLVNSSSTSTSIRVTDSVSKKLTSSSNLLRNFTITVNPRGEDLLADSDTLTLVDSYSSGLAIDLTSLHVKESADAAEDVPFSVQMDASAHTMTLVIPDNKKLIITYSASIEAPLGSTVNLFNRAYWYGYSSSASSWSANSVKVEAAGSVSFGTNPTISITKVDSQNVRTTLQGAQFAIYATTYADQTFRITGDPIAVGTTGADGTVSFGGSSDTYKLNFNTVYGIVETSAPTGYIRTTTPIYAGIFRAVTVNGTNEYPKDWDSISSTDVGEYWAQAELDSWTGVNLYYTSSTYSYTWEDSRTSVLISKNFYDGTSSTAVSFPAGEFRFGLYYSGQLLQTLTISNVNGRMTYLRTENGVTEAENQPLFTGLNTNDVYSIYELDEQGNPIANSASATISGEVYEVTYPNGSTALSTSDASVQTFSISNRTSVTISGTKTWDDNGNRDGKRPKSITVKLLADEQKVAEKTVTAADNWKYTFTDLPVYSSGRRIKYEIAENAVENYSTIINGYDITNKYTPEETSLSVLKRWNDSENQDGRRPNSVTIQLLADGKETGNPVTVTESDGWIHTWTGLQMYKDGGTKIEYTVKETSELPEGYTSTVSGDAMNGYVITNSYTSETINISGSKAWNDSSNQDGKRPDSITVNLFADGQKMKSQEVTSSTGWTYSFKDLPKFKDGKAIDYTITEEAVPEYSTAISGNRITNSYTPGKTSVTVTKKWDDNNNQDGIRMPSIQVQLLADGEASGDPVTLDRNSEWTYTWKDLDEMSGGKAITYTVKEVSVPAGYTAAVTGNAAEGFILTNTHTPETTSISGTKTWDDNSNSDGKRPDSITVKLLANGEKVSEKTVTAADNWEYTFSDLPVYSSGRKITYAIAEDAVENYSTIINGYNITNKYTHEKTSLSVLKRWNDSENQDGKRPDSVTIQLYADGQKYGDSVTLKASDSWMHTWTNLQMYKDGGTKIEYTVKETTDLPEGYTSTVSGSAEGGYVITNSYTPETTSISGTKTWNDVDNQDGRRPDSIVVKLLADGIETDRAIVEADENGEWRYSFTGLPANSAGKKISYSILEENVPDYSPEYSGYDITNSYTPGKTSVTVTKVWDDGNNQDNIRPESVQVQLYADGIASGDPVTLNSDGNWTYTWTDLDQMKNGAEIVYTIQETSSADGYTDSVSGDASKGFTIINHHTPAEKPGTDTSTNNSSSGGDSSPSAEPVSQKNLVPDTADHTDLLQHGITAIASLTIALIAVVAYRKYE